MKRKKAKKARKSYVSNPAKKTSRRRRRSAPKAARSRRRYRSNPADSIKDVGALVAAGAVSAVVGAKAFSKLPISPMLQNIGMVLAGAAVAILGRKKHAAFVGAGAGLVMAGASRLILNKIPQLAGEMELSPDEQAAVLVELAPEATEEEEVSLNGGFNGGFNGSFAGGMNAASM